jgi:glycosyltransferase involved in cell wall biosynthesis
LPSTTKNIVIIGSAYPLRGGGIATFNERLATQFQNEGHNVTIYSFSLQYPNFLFPGKSQYSNEAAPSNLKILSCINSINPINWIKIGVQLKKQQPEIIVVRYWLPFMGPCFGTILRIAKKNKQSKIICIADNIIPHEKRIGDYIFTKYFVKPIDAFICMSISVLNDLKLFSSKPSQLVAHPLYDNFGEIISKEEARNHLQLHQSDIILLFFGFIRKYKGLDLLIQALSEIQNSKSKIPNLKLLVAGEFYDDRKMYDDLISNLKLENDIILHTEFIPNDDVKYYFCAADYVIQPYKNATQSGVTPLAYHFEKPMLVTNVGGLPDLVPNKKVGLIAEPNSTDIANKLRELITFEQGYFKENIKQEKQKYNWNNLTKSILSLSLEK